jgi:hypothetical protein
MCSSNPATIGRTARSWYPAMSAWAVLPTALSLVSTPTYEARPPRAWSASRMDRVLASDAGPSSTTVAASVSSAIRPAAAPTTTPSARAG